VDGVSHDTQYQFEWDENKARANLAGHGISFNEAKLAFSNPNRITEKDDRFD
jgi:uncharacterized DUF497 family protein